jgi:hypothetical protein
MVQYLIDAKSLFHGHEYLGDKVLDFVGESFGLRDYI